MQVVAHCFNSVAFSGIIFVKRRPTSSRPSSDANLRIAEECRTNSFSQLEQRCASVTDLAIELISMDLTICNTPNNVPDVIKHVHKASSIKIDDALYVCSISKLPTGLASF